MVDSVDNDSRMTGYTKLFGSIIASTIWREDDKTRLVWITMLAMKDRNGIVEASLPGLADMARVSVAEARAAIAKLEGPDPDSRTKAHEGRRIQPTDGGWLILNHQKFRDKMRSEERTEYMRLKKREERARQRNVNPCQPESTSVNACRPIADAEADTEAEVEGVFSRTACEVADDTPTPPQGSAAHPGEERPALKRSVAASARTPPEAITPPHPKPPAPAPCQPGPKDEPLTNKPKLTQALGYFAASDYTEAEVRAAYLTFEAAKGADGSWWWGQRPVGDWRAALESRMADARARRPEGKPASSVEELLRKTRRDVRRAIEEPGPKDQ